MVGESVTKPAGDYSGNNNEIEFVGKSENSVESVLDVQLVKLHDLGHPNSANPVSQSAGGSWVCLGRALGAGACLGRVSGRVLGASWTVGVVYECLACLKREKKISPSPISFGHPFQSLSIH